MNIKPIGDRVLIKAFEKEEKTASGIFLPETASEDKKEQGEIIALGGGDLVKDSELAVGQKIIFGGWSKEIKDGAIVYKVVQFEDILAIVE
jgi:chaperonin GroES